MSEHPSATAARRSYDAFTTGDVDAALRGFADDVVFHIGGRGPYSGDHKGKDAVAGFLAHAYELTGGTTRFDIHHIYADDSHVVVALRETATRASDGATLDIEEAHVWHLDHNGRFVEFWDIPEDHETHDHFFS